jgi:plasmid stability protein
MVRCFQGRKAMSVIIELKPEIEARVAAQAAAHGMSVEAYIESILESLAITQDDPTFKTMTAAERAGAWEAWAASHSPNIPVILNDSREAIYGDDGR